MSSFIAWCMEHLNYWTITFLMTLESTVIPIPSELVVPPAAYRAAADSSDINVILVVLCATIGANLGALINYTAARYLGRPIIYAFVDSKWGHMLRLSGEKMERAEKYFNDHGVVSTLVGRLIPVVRQLISIPAGLSKMNIWAFMLYTTLGALVWNCVLALLGWLAYQTADPTVIERYSNILSYIIIGLFVAVILFFVIRYFIKKRQKQ